MIGINRAETERRPTIGEIVKAVEVMGRSGMVRYFPCDADSREMIVDELYSMVPSVEALRWLVSTMIRGVGEWRSLRELRAGLSTRYTPLDADRFPTSPWFTPYGDWGSCEPLRLDAGPEEPRRQLPAIEPAEGPKVPECCPRCDNTGLLESFGAAEHWRYCECESGARKRKQEPDLVGVANAAVAKLLRLPRRLVTPPAPREVQHA